MSQDHEHDDGQMARMDWSLWRRVLRFARPYKVHLIWLGIVAALTAACEMAFLLLPGTIIDHVKAYGHEADLTWYLVAFGIATVGLSLCIWTFIMLAGVIASGTQRDIRAAAFEKLQRLSFSYFDRRPVGWLMARLTSDCSGLSRIIGWALLDIVWGVCMLAGSAAVMLYLNWKLALIVLVITPVLIVASRYFQLHLLLTSRKVRKANSHCTAAFNEGICGVRTSKSLVREERNLLEFQGLSGEMYRHSMSNAIYAAVFLPVVLTICSLGVGLAVWYGGGAVLDGVLTLGTLVIFIHAAGQFSNPIQEMARTLTLIQGAQASAERIQGLLDAEVTIKDSEEVERRIESQRALPGDGSGATYGGKRGVSEFEKAIDGGDARIARIEFCGVRFTYEGGQTVLEEFDLEVEAGQTIALVGPTGGGKSTIVSLVCRFYEPSEGEVRINGVDYRERSLDWLQSQLGMVLQTPHLFSGTVRENIRYGRLEASDAEVEEAAQLVNAHEFISNLSEGYETEVGEGGNQLSTGQKQLVSLARAILADPQVLVMDEATSSVDTETEGLIQRGVERALEGRIAFVIAHRLSTIRSADRILVIEGGRIVEDGDHEGVMRLGGRYYRLYTNQFAEEAGEGVLGGR